MNIYATIILLFFFVGTVDAQSRKERRMLRKQERIERKMQKEARLAEQKDAILDLAKDRNLVLEADALFDRYMNQYNMVNNSFIMFKGNEMVLQTANPWGHPGFNGMGGITLSGQLTDYQISEGKDLKPVTITAQVNTSGLGPGTVLMTISSNGNARGTFRDNWGNRITFSGQITDLENSRMFEGMDLLG